MPEDHGNAITNALDRFMPYYFKHINPIIHQYKSDDYNLNENQIKVVMALYHIKNLTPTQLSHNAFIYKGSLTTIIRSLLNMGLVNRKYDKTDERQYHLNLTSKGEMLVSDKFKKDTKDINKVFSDIRKNEVEIILAGLNMLCDVLDRSVEK